MLGEALHSLTKAFTPAFFTISMGTGGLAQVGAGRSILWQSVLLRLCYMWLFHCRLISSRTGTGHATLRHTIQTAGQASNRNEVHL